MSVADGDKFFRKVAKDFAGFLLDDRKKNRNTELPPRLYTVQHYVGLKRWSRLGQIESKRERGVFFFPFLFIFFSYFKSNSNMNLCKLKYYFQFIFHFKIGEEPLLGFQKKQILQLFKLFYFQIFFSFISKPFLISFAKAI